MECPTCKSDINKYARDTLKVLLTKIRAFKLTIFTNGGNKGFTPQLGIPYMNNSKISAWPALNISKLYTFEIQ